MLDAIASAPFLVVVAQQEQETAGEAELSSSAAPLATAPVEVVPVFEAPAEREPAQPEHETPQAETPVRDHEIAATAPEAPKVEQSVEQTTIESAQAEARRHAIHGTPEEPAPASDKAPRKAGWWNRRKTG